MAGIYLHIPFCKQACHYCDFHFSTNLQSRTVLVQAMAKELHMQRHFLDGQPISTVYFGGGTPSLLQENDFALLFSALRNNFTFTDKPEITLEANPDDLDEPKLVLLKRMGINRLSIGIQSFHDSLLQRMNRAHSARSAITCVNMARKVGFDNISIDLIYAIPNETTDMWLADIEQVLALSPEHISSYSLTVEPKTAFGKWAKQGKLNLASDETAALHLEALVEKLEAAGYEHYETSNFSKPGRQSQHNTSYWKQISYLGVGPSAHSYNGASRQYNIANNQTYIKAIADDQIPYDKETLSRSDMINEFLLTSLRTSWGCDTGRLYSLYEYDILTDQKVYIDNLLLQNFASLNGSALQLSKKGKLIADKIASDLFIGL